RADHSGPQRQRNPVDPGSGEAGRRLARWIYTVAVTAHGGAGVPRVGAARTAGTMGADREPHPEHARGQAERLAIRSKNARHRRDGGAAPKYVPLVPQALWIGARAAAL